MMKESFPHHLHQLPCLIIVQELRQLLGSTQVQTYEHLIKKVHVNGLRATGLRGERQQSAVVFLLLDFLHIL